MSFFGNLSGGGQSNGNLVNLINEGAFLVDVRSPVEFAGGSACATMVAPWAGDGRATVLPHSSSALEPVSSAMIR